MPLDAGIRLGPYEILAPLGQGGMGEIYRATDTRLDRIVAIKILSPALADDVQFRERFEREARAISALDHPHICALYDVGELASDPGALSPDPESRPLRYLVIQYLDGETLEARIAKGPLPPAEALNIAVQIADALSAAHRAGIVHRDLKPGNVMLTKGGAKLLDFGLAKVSAPVVAVSSTMAPTTPTVTAQGAILGTFQYMAPEQIEGLDADARTDIFAFGALLHEMLTGKKAFEGKTRASLIGSILKDEPPSVSQVQPVTPPALDRIVSTCLAKEPDDRWQTARDLLRELRWVANSPAGAVTATAAASPVAAVRSRWRTFAGIAGGVGAGIVVTALVAWLAMRYTKQSPRFVRFAITVPDQRLALAGDRNIAISPDGRHIVYRANAGVGTSATTLFVRALDQLDARPLPGTGASPFFSPDSRWIGYFDQGQIKKVSITGGPAIAIGRYNGLSRGATWGPDGTVIFGTSLTATGLLTVPAGGGEPKKVTGLDQGETGHGFPSFLPGGRAVLFTVARSGQSADNNEIAVLDLKTGRRKVLVGGGSQALYIDGHLVYAVSGTLRSVRFDPDRLEVQGDPVPVLEQVMTLPTGAGNFAVADDGTLAYVQGQAAAAAAPRTLVWVDRKGRETPIEAPPRAYDMPRLSPDGTRVALQISDQDSDIWIWDLMRRTLTRLTFDPGVDNLPVWMPDSKFILFNSTRSGPRNLFRQAADGTGAVERLTTTENNQFPFSISPDGKRLVLGEVSSQGSAADVSMLALDGPPQSKPIVQTPFSEYGAQISPDGRWMAYQSNESGQFQIYVRPFPNVDSGRWQVSTSGGTRARWARDGRELFYLDGDGTLTSVAVRADGATFSASNPTKVFEKKYYAGFNLGAYDVSTDGQRFLMIKDDRPADQAAASANLVVVLNWIEELKARTAAR